jgi:pyruvate decarboxylase
MLGASSASRGARMDVMIDDTLVQCLREKRPVYIGLPTDLIKQKVSAGSLKKPIITGHLTLERQNWKSARVSELTDMIGPIIGTSKRPVIVVDGFARHYGHRFVAVVNDFVRAWGIPTFTTPFGKGIVDETDSNFHGIYTKDVWWSEDDQKWVEPDLCILIAPLKTDTNTCCFTALSEVTKTIEIGQYDVSVYGKSYGYHGFSVLLRLARPNVCYPNWIERLKLDPRCSVRDRKKELEQLPDPSADAVIDQDRLWFRISKFFQPGDLILTETGTAASSGGQDFVLPHHARMINSAAWLSIGYTQGACVGVELARMEWVKWRSEEPGEFTRGRTILF